MILTRKQFDVLVCIEKVKKKLTQRELEELCGYSLGIINKTIKELSDLELINDGKITKKGLEVLDKYRVKRAIFIAAGFGSRLVPITLNTPKPLVRVNGVRIIDTLIDACINVGIEDIIIVRGYLKEQFDQLLYKYPNIKFIDNEFYNEANNISSAYMARDLIKNSYVFESDLLLANKDIITKYHYTSDVLGIWKDRTDDWCLSVDKDNNVIEEKVGGLNCYQMVGIYYFNEEDGKKLESHIKEAYEAPGGKERYWETVPNQVYKGEYKIEVRSCKEDDIVEIDTFKELKAIDKTYDV